VACDPVHYNIYLDGIFQVSVDAQGDCLEWVERLLVQNPDSVVRYDSHWGKWKWQSVEVGPASGHTEADWGLFAQECEKSL